uniref:DUF4795 domain-containing protein n=1 Tax=Anopheles dirus TaxID=7168 RepID=A0A182NUH1_9DIPT
MLEGCRSHLETVKEEILALKTRCQNQHEDTLKLAGALDSLVQRMGTQEPKVSKLETDTHCLGMLISEYEVNFGRIEKHLKQHDVKLREFEWTYQRMDKDRDALRADVRSLTEQANYLSTVKADKVDVQTELNRRALGTDMQQRVPYDVFNEVGRDLTRTVTKLSDELHEVDENLKTVQYELMKGLGSKASAHDLSEMRKQLVGALSRWQKLEKDQKSAQVMTGDTSSAAVAANGEIAFITGSSKCLTCGIQTTLEGSHGSVPQPSKFVPTLKVKVRNAGGFHTKTAPPEKVFRTGSLGAVKKPPPQDVKRAEHCWKL